MKILTYCLIAAAVVCALLIGTVVPASAQSVATTTTLAANAGATDTVITVTSNTGFTAGNFVWADAEQMLIRAVSGTAITVQRGVNGTAARAHDNAERIITGGSDYFKTNDPDFGADCTRGQGQAAFLPWINVRNGLIWTCASGQTNWSATSTQVVTFNSIPTSF